MEHLQRQLDQRRQQQLYRQRRIADSPHGPEMRIDGHPVLSFCSNDYLGLANHPEVNRAFQNGVNRWGSGSGAAHLINGHCRAHHELESELAAFTGRSRALLFSTGYMANLGFAGALAGRGDAVFEDRLNHASLLDAGLLSGARFRRFRHADVADLDRKLERATYQTALVMTDGVFSMDGDRAPLRALADVCRTHRAWLCVDDAHGLGVLGGDGGGSLSLDGLTTDDVPVLMGTLGKAFGTFGAFVAGSDALIETLIQHARTYVYTTALPPAVAEASRAALALIRRESWRREQLRARIEQFQHQARQLDLPCMPSDTAIQPLLVGDSGQALALSEALWDKGILVTAIRPPTVPPGSARLRITLSAGHTEAHVRQLLQALDAVFRQRRSPA